jgi:CubicO group peptidase (beta-lactamase class C family)
MYSFTFKIKQSIKALLTLLLLFYLSLGHTQNLSKTIDSIYTQAYQKGEFHGNILVANQGKVVYKKSFGMADETSQQPLNENTIFELASVSKQFTAAAIVMLHREGKLKIDDKISKLLPELSHYSDVSIRHLLYHTGGLKDYMALMQLSYDQSKIANNNDIIALLSKPDLKPDFSPGTQYEYSNTGYALLASIIERASGMSYGNYLEKKIFRPLKMKRTSIHTRRYAPRKIDNYAYGYVMDEKTHQYILPDNHPDHNYVIWLDGIVGDGTVNSTVLDLLKWDQALHGNTLFSSQEKEWIFTPGTLNDGSKSNYAFGWMIEEDPNMKRIASHSGGWPGYHTYIERHLDKNKTIIVLSNHESPIKTKFIRRAFYGIPEPKTISPSDRIVMDLPIEVLKKYEGIYAFNESISLTFFIKNDLLYAQLTGQNALPIYPERENFFFLKMIDAQLEFITDAEGKINQVILHQNGLKQLATRK